MESFTIRFSPFKAEDLLIHSSSWRFRDKRNGTDREYRGTRVARTEGDGRERGKWGRAIEKWWRKSGTTRGTWLPWRTEEEEDLEKKGSVRRAKGKE